MRRLYLQVYLAFVAILVVFGVLVGLAWHHGGLVVDDQGTLDGAGALIAERLPAAADPAAQDAALAALALKLRIHLTLWSDDGRVLAWAGERLPYPGPGAPSARCWPAPPTSCGRPWPGSAWPWS